MAELTRGVEGLNEIQGMIPKKIILDNSDSDLLTTVELRGKERPCKTSRQTQRRRLRRPKGSET